VVAQFSKDVGVKVSKLKPAKLITNKNPFLFRARIQSDVNQLTTLMAEAFLSSSEETKFGNVLEKIALVICAHAKGGRKSSTAKIDLEYDEGNRRTIIQVKSGPNWGNSSQRDKLVDSFKSARRVLGTSIEVRCIEGICYGPSCTNHLGTHLQLVGKDFWQDISDWPDTANRVLEIIGSHAENGLNKMRNQVSEKLVSYMKDEQIVNAKGLIQWDELLKLVMKPKNRSSAKHD